MNTLCNVLTDRIHPVVEAFLYCDTLGPAVGQITAEAILRGEPVDPHYALSRFNA